MALLEKAHPDLIELQQVAQGSPRTALLEARYMPARQAIPDRHGTPRRTFGPASWDSAETIVAGVATGAARTEGGPWPK